MEEGKGRWPKLQRIFGRRKTKTSKSKERDTALISKVEERGRALTFGAERLTATEIKVNLVSVEDHQCASPIYTSIEDLEVIQKTLRDLAESTTPYNQGQIPQQRGLAELRIKMPDDSPETIVFPDNLTKKAIFSAPSNEALMDQQVWMTTSLMVYDWGDNKFSFFALNLRDKFALTVNEDGQVDFSKYQTDDGTHNFPNNVPRFTFNGCQLRTKLNKTTYILYGALPTQEPRGFLTAKREEEWDGNMEELANFSLVTPTNLP